MSLTMKCKRTPPVGRVLMLMGHGWHDDRAALLRETVPSARKRSTRRIQEPP
jgi:hypothetical protein